MLPRNLIEGRGQKAYRPLMCPPLPKRPCLLQLHDFLTLATLIAEIIFTPSPPMPSLPSDLSKLLHINSVIRYYGGGGKREGDGHPPPQKKSFSEHKVVKVKYFMNMKYLTQFQFLRMQSTEFFIYRVFPKNSFLRYLCIVG